MVFFTAGAQLLDAIIIKTAMFTVEQVLNMVKWGGGSIYSYYRPPELTECEKLRIENIRLKDELEIQATLRDDEILILKDT